MGKKRDVSLLITVAVLLGASGGILHGLKKQPRSFNDEENTVTVSLTEALELLQPLLIARSFETAAQSIQQFSDTVIVQTMTALVAGQGPELPEADVINLLLKTAQSTNDGMVRSSLFAMLQTHFSQKPIFYYAALYDCAAVIPAIMEWARTYKKNMNIWILSSLQEAISSDKPELMDQLYAQGVRSNAHIASQLLSNVVENNRNVEFVPFLVRRLAADPNYSPDGKKTVLIQAISNKNIAMVKTLLQEGADPKLMLDEAVGTPAQNAYGKGYHQIERVIRDAVK